MKKRHECGKCGSEVGVRFYIIGHRCPLHRPLAGDSLRTVREEPKEEEPSLPYPEPEIRARTVDLSVVRRGPKSFVKLIEAAEEKFSYDLREARGWMPDKNGDPKNLVDSVGVRVACPRGRLALVWVEGRLDTSLAWTPKRGVFPITLDQAKAFLGGHEIKYIPKKKAEVKAPAKKTKEGMR